jgi:hypothetical protein
MTITLRNVMMMFWTVNFLTLGLYRLVKKI